MKSFYSDYSLQNYSDRRVDSNELMFFSRELTDYDPREYQNLKNELTLLKILKPTEIGRYQKIYNYKMFDGTGRSKIISANSGHADDIPFVGVGGGEFQSPIVDIACALYFSDADILAGKDIRRDIVKMLGEQALRSNLEAINRFGFYGDKTASLPGIFVTPQIPSAAFAKDWTLATTTAADMYQDLVKIYTKIKTATANTISPDTCLIAPGLYNLIDVTIFNGFNGVTVRQQFEAAQGVKVISAPELTGKALTAGIGAATKDSLFMFKNIESYISPIISLLFEMREAQAIGLRYESICLSRFGGVVVRQPKGCYIANNATDVV